MTIIFTVFLAFQWENFNKDINKLNPAVLKIESHRSGYQHHFNFLSLFNIWKQVCCSVLLYAICMCQHLWIFSNIPFICRSIWNRISDKIWKFDKIFNNQSNLHSLVISFSRSSKYWAVCPSLFSCKTELWPE